MKNFQLQIEGKTLPLPCVSTAFVAKTLPLPCVSTAFATKTLPLPCVSTALMAKTLPFPCGPQVSEPTRTKSRCSSAKLESTPSRWTIHTRYPRCRSALACLLQLPPLFPPPLPPPFPSHVLRLVLPCEFTAVSSFSLSLSLPFPCPFAVFPCSFHRLPWLQAFQIVLSSFDHKWACE